MPISKNIADFLKRYKQAKHLSIKEFSEEAQLSTSSLGYYLSGSGNPRADSLEQLAERLGVTVAEIVSDPLPGLERAETIIPAAKELSALPPERRERGLQLVRELMELFAEGDQS